MKFSALSTAAVLVSLLGQLPVTDASCFYGACRVPENMADTLATLLLTAGNAEAQSTYPKTGTYWLSSTIDNFKGGRTCLNFGIENISGHLKEISTATAVEGLLREWVTCDNGGKTDYRDGSLSGWRFM
ncbi:hypothetical protein CTA2_6249 [Colletotrichum tanaceti]|uniref:Ecp2 effector protein domain-containing protein n=1 Tax=Colletotrichum tanaceti TaxID=1306861 RepID=A0A4U6X2V2_9PEZI|nr:hypothetical protein CTA2_6249 [Colletotrichum tanaceti]TKW49233.1 hypothetical protein CTA1_585 [Colletotrichum tanaceti]